MEQKEGCREPGEDRVSWPLASYLNVRSPPCLDVTTGKSSHSIPSASTVIVPPSAEKVLTRSFETSAEHKVTGETDQMHLDSRLSSQHGTSKERKLDLLI